MSDRTIRCLIVDDEPAARGALRSLLEQEPDIEIAGELADGETALRFLRKSPADLLFLDIQMPEMNGFDMLRELDGASVPVIVFVTAYDQYALRAFDSEAVDYLLKPFSDERFHQALARARRQIRSGRIGSLSDQLRRLLARTAPSEVPGEYRSRLLIKHEGRITILPLAEVDWLEADGDLVKVHAGTRTFPVRETMKELESQIDPARFVRIHRSTIISVDRIKEMQPYFKGDYVVILRDGTNLKLSRRFKGDLEKALGRNF
jgi:two-component system, LytTR family, response regulator